jgi:CRP-like cAMP-binding protein
MMNLVIARFFRLAGLNMNSPADTSYMTVNHETIKGRLTEFYHLGFLKTLSLEEVSYLSNAARIIYCRSGQKHIERGQHADSMYFLLVGELEVFIENEVGEEILVASIWPGDFVGEMSLLTGEPRSANVIAKKNSTLLEISKADITPIFKENPELIHEISALLESRKKSNELLLNKESDLEQVDENVKALAKKILHFFFGHH